jgi:hypothetical protein
MKIVSVLQAQSVKALRINPSPAANPLYLPAVVKAVTERYNFVGIPQEADIAAASLQPDPSVQGKPLIFYQGIVELEGRSIVIQNLSIFEAGVVVTTRSNTKDGDAVISDLLSWAPAQFEVSVQELKPAIGYSSQIDCQFEKPLAKLLPALSRLGKTMITEKLSPFWETMPAFELTTIIYAFDRAKYPTFAPINLRIDRRAGHNFDDNVFWSDAPLSTDHHIAFLTTFEKTCLEALQ